MSQGLAILLAVAVPTAGNKKKKTRDKKTREKTRRDWLSDALMPSDKNLATKDATKTFQS